MPTRLEATPAKFFPLSTSDQGVYVGWPAQGAMRTTISGLDTLQRDSQARRIGQDLYREADAISPKTVEAVSAAVSRMSTNSEHGRLVAEGFAEAMMSEAAVKHLSGI